MATPRPFNTYSNKFKALFRRAMQEPVRMDFDSPDAARAMRGYLYSYRTAIQRADDAPPDLVLTTPLLRFELHNCTLIVSRQPTSARIRKATQRAEQSAADAGAPDSSSPRSHL